LSKARDEQEPAQLFSPVLSWKTGWFQSTRREAAPTPPNLLQQRGERGPHGVMQEDLIQSSYARSMTLHATTVGWKDETLPSKSTATGRIWRPLAQKWFLSCVVCVIAAIPVHFATALLLQKSMSNNSVQTLSP